MRYYSTETAKYNRRVSITELSFNSLDFYALYTKVTRRNYYLLNGGGREPLVIEFAKSRDTYTHLLPSQP